MNIYPFINLLPDGLKLKYIKEMTENGALSKDLWKEIIIYLGKTSNIDHESIIENILQEADPDEREYLNRLAVKSNMSYLALKKSPIKIVDLEEIVDLDKDFVKQFLSNYHEEDLIKMTFIVSPTLLEYFKEMFPEIDFVGGREKIGQIRVNEVTGIHKKVIHDINYISSKKKIV